MKLERYVDQPTERGSVISIECAKSRSKSSRRSVELAVSDPDTFLQ